MPPTLHQYVTLRLAAAAPPQAMIVSGTAVVANDVLPGGIEITADLTVAVLVVRGGTAPTGAALIVRLKLTRAGVTTTIGSVPLDAGAVRTATTLPTPLELLAGDVVTADVTQVGSSVAGADVWVGMLAAA